MTGGMAFGLYGHLGGSSSEELRRKGVRLWLGSKGHGRAAWTASEHLAPLPFPAGWRVIVLIRGFR